MNFEKNGKVVKILEKKHMIDSKRGFLTKAQNFTMN